MSTNKDPFEQIIKDEYDRIAREEEKEAMAEDPVCIPEGLMEDVYAKIEARKEAADREKDLEREKAYAGLSEEDRRALELGRKMLEEEKNKEKNEEKSGEGAVKIVRKKKPRRLYLALAAALVLALGVCVVSMGGPERIVMLMKQAVGDREVEKVNSSEENLVIIEEKEEEAYQKIEEEFGVYPVRMANTIDIIEFDNMELDESLQTAELYYWCKGERLVYFINASYSGTSWGMDVEDEIVKAEKKEIEGCEIEMKEYRTLGTNEEKHSARFSYQGLEYFLVGTIGEKDFNYIIKNLFVSE